MKKIPKNPNKISGRNSVNSVGIDQVTQTEPVTITNTTALKHEIVRKYCFDDLNIDITKTDLTAEQKEH